MPRIGIGDCQLYFERHGAGFPLLLISGLPGTVAFWREQVRAFAKHYDVVVHDQRGVGQSEHCRMSYTVDRMTHDVVELMDALGVERAHIIGHSTGGAIAQILAIEHADRVASIVTVGSWPKPDAYFRRNFNLQKEILWRLGASAFVQSLTLLLYPAWWIASHNEELRQIEAQTLATLPPPEIVASRIDAIMAFDRTADLHRIRTPALVVGCEDDRFAPPYFSEDLSRRIPDAEIKMFPRGGHSFTEVMAREFNTAVLPFLKAHTPPA